MRQLFDFYAASFTVSNRIFIVLREFIKHLRVRIKLLIAFASIQFMPAITTVLAVVSINKSTYFKGTEEKNYLLRTEMEKMERSSRDFIYEIYQGFKSSSFRNHIMMSS